MRTSIIKQSTTKNSSKKHIWNIYLITLTRQKHQNNPERHEDRKAWRLTYKKLKQGKNQRMTFTSVSSSIEKKKNLFFNQSFRYRFVIIVKSNDIHTPG